MAKKLPTIISSEEYEKLIEETLKLEKSANKKKERIREYRVAMILGFEAGLRISEIVGYLDRVPKLKPENIEDNYIRIKSGKGNKDRIVPRPKSLNKKAISLLPLSCDRRSLQHFISKLGMKVLKKRISFHTLRHGFATTCLTRGIPLHEVQQFMGHSRIDITGIYLHANPEESLKRYEELF